jgi:opacity protein-like surface antigen
MTLRPLAAALLLVPAFPLAAPTATRPAARPGPKPAAAPAKPAAKPADGAAGGLEVGGFAGYETADFSGLSLRADAELPVRQLARKVKLSVVGSLGYSRLTWSPGFGVKGTANVVKLVPALRFTLPVAPKLSLFADAGLGLAYVSTTIDLPPAFNAPDVTDSTFNVMLRVGAGAWYHATERLKLGVLLELDPILGDFGFRSAAGVTSGSQTTFLAQLGAQVRL